MTNTTETSAQVAELLPSSSGPLATSPETAILSACTNLLFLSQFQQILGNINLFLNFFCFKSRRSGEKDKFPLVATLVDFSCSMGSFSILIHPCLQKPFPLETPALRGRVIGSFAGNPTTCTSSL